MDDMSPNLPTKSIFTLGLALAKETGYHDGFNSSFSKAIGGFFEALLRSRLHKAQIDVGKWRHKEEKLLDYSAWTWENVGTGDER